MKTSAKPRPLAGSAENLKFAVQGRAKVGAENRPVGHWGEARGTNFAALAYHCVERLLQLLPTRPQPLLIRYGAAALLVLIFFVFRLGIGQAAGEYSFILFVSPILLASILFDRGSGFVATVMSVLLISSQVNWEVDPVHHIGALTLFSVVSVFIVIVGEGMRTAWEREIEAQAAAELLREEQDHRIKNELGIASSLIMLQARAQADPVVRNALDAAVSRLNVLAKSHDHLRMGTGDHATDMHEYLGELCKQLGDGLRGARPIAITVEADRVTAQSHKATRIGLIVNELVTNALKHAFPDDRAGTVHVKLESTESHLLLVVEDDGAGCPEDVKESLGSRLTRLLVQELKGTVLRSAPPKGCRITITIPTSG
jgi:two-component sensor histidine kinase